MKKGGYVRLCGGKHYHETLKQWAGLWVFAELADCWGVRVDVWPDEPWKDGSTMLSCANESDWFSKAINLESQKFYQTSTDFAAG